ncbi:MAG: CRTAC1 family protein [Deltaproteobacteria bacterium]|nr:CRTAC1 family protein [Deltaproteobacteria bacterium]
MPRSSASLVALAALLAAPALGEAPARAQPFEDITSASGLTLTTTAIGINTLEAAVSLGDLDGDGDADLVMSGANRPLVLYLRGADGVFARPLGQPTTPNDGATPTGHLLFDKDGDGDLDLLVLRKGAPVLLENDGAARFTDVTARSLPGSGTWLASAAAGDLDGDGDLDLVVVGYIDVVAFPLHLCAPNRILANDGHGRFTDVTEAWGFDTRIPGCSFVAGLVDLDDDLDLDIVVANDFGQFLPGSELWRNDGPTADGGVAFTDVTAAMGLGTPIYAMGVAIGDADADGRLELAFTNIGEPQLFELGDDGRLADVSAARGVGPRFSREGFQVTWEAELEDLDGDGWQDLFLAGGNLLAAPFIENALEQPNVLLRGTAAGAFVEAPPSLQVGTAAGSMFRAMALRDLDGDGRTDLVMAHLDGRLAAFRNAGTGPAPTRLRLVPSATAPGAAGARVTATCRGVTRVARVTAGRHYGVADEGALRLTFPAPCAPAGDPVALTVRWPSGYEQAVATTTGAALVVAEPAWLTVGEDVVTADFRGAAVAPDEVVVAGIGVAVGPTVEVEAGRWQATLAATPGAATRRLDLWADGALLGAHPRPGPASEAPPRFSLTTYPQALVARRTYEATARVRDAAGAEVGEGHAVSLWLDGVEHPLTRAASGWRATLVAPDAATVMTATLTLDGETAPETVMVPVAPPFSPERSVVSFQDAAVAESEVPYHTVWVRASLLDDNGASFGAREEDVRLVRAGGERLEPDQIYVSAPVVSAHWEHARLEDGEVVQLEIAGEAAGEPETVRHLPDGSSPAGLVSGARSWCAFSERQLWADGQDVATALVFLKDAGGQNAPSVAAQTTYAYEGGLAPGPQGLTGTSGQPRVSVRAGSTPGIGRLVARIAGGPEVACEIPQVAPPPLLAPSVAQSEVRVATASLPLRVGVPVTVTVVPRSAGGRAVGSGLALTATATGGFLSGNPAYQGMGRYTVGFLPDGSAAPSVTVTSAAPAFSLSQTFPLADVGGGDASEGDVADAGAGDADVVDGGADAVDAEVVDAEVVEDVEDVEVDEVLEDVGPLPDADADPDPDPDADADPDADPDPDADAAPDTDTDADADADADAAPDTAPDTAADTAPAPDTATAPDTGPATDTAPDAVADAAPDVDPRDDVRTDGCAGGDAAPTSLLALLAALLLLARRRYRSPGFMRPLGL